MRTKITVLATMVALALAGCTSTGAHHLAAGASRQPTATTPAPSANAVASAHERELVNWLAESSTNPAQVASIVSGPVMMAYIQIEAMDDVAAAANGHPVPKEKVSTIPGGYQGCASLNGSSYCDSFTGWVTDASGRITDLNIDGGLIASRIATCTPAGGSQLAITDVVAYWPATEATYVQVDYQAHNISGHVFGNGKPAWLSVFDPTGGGQVQEDDTGSILPGSLRPGESVVVALDFQTQTPTGTLTLRTNDQHRSVIASCTLRTP